MRNVFLGLIACLLFASASLALEFTEVDVTTGPAVYWGLFAGDMDSDGNQDLVASSMETQITWFSNTDGTGLNWASDNFSSTMVLSRLTPADLDGDGDLDVVYRDELTGDVCFVENQIADGNGGVFHVIGTTAMMLPSVRVAVGDLDGDGDLDVVYPFGSDLVWLENLNGDATTWQQGVIQTYINNSMFTELADVDGDGDLDVIAPGLDGTSDQVAIYLNDNGDATSWTVVETTSSFINARDCAAGDLDDDGDLDFVIYNQMTPGLHVFTNDDGTGTSWTVESLGTVQGDVQFGFVDLADMDLDGDLDVISTSMLQPIEIFLNNGTGTSWEQFSYGDGPQLIADIDVGDLNGDGYPDLAYGHAFGIKVMLQDGPLAVPATIAEIQTGLHPDGTLVEVTGVVTQAHETCHTDYVDVFIQDDSGYGIMLYSPDPADGVGLDRGDEVTVVGTIDHYFDTTELVDFSFTEISTGNPLPDPMTFATGDFNTSLEYEGVWAELAGFLTTEAPDDPTDDFNITVNDGSGDATVRCYLNVGQHLFNNSTIGDWVIVRGVMDTYSGACQMQPSQYSDTDEPEPDEIDYFMDEDEYDEGDFVVATGVITQGHGTVHANYVDVYIQDDSQAGMMVYSPDPLDGEGLDRGDYVKITGSIGEDDGVRQLVDFHVWELGVGYPMPAPEVETTGDFSGWDEDNVGVWTKLTGTLSNVGSPGTNYNMIINDGTGPATVRVYGEMFDFFSDFANGDEVTIFGVADLVGGSPRLQPSWEFDLVNNTQLPQVTFTVDTPTDYQSVPATGGSLEYTVLIQNNTGQTYQNVTYSTTVMLPSGNEYDTIFEQTFNLNPNATINQTVYPGIPETAPGGTYAYIIRFGRNNHILERFFFFTKEEGDDVLQGVDEMNPADWTGNGLAGIAADTEPASTLPVEFAMHAAYPNPFNPTTSIRVDLPEAADLSVAVYNVSGQRVATLTEGQQQAGQHSFLFDARGLASGVYFVHATVPGELNSVRKITLMK